MPVASPGGATSPTRRQPPKGGPPQVDAPSPHTRPEGAGNINFERGGSRDSRDSGGGSGLRPLQSGGAGWNSKQQQQQQPQGQWQEQGQGGPPPAGAPPGLSLNTVYTAPVEEKKARKQSDKNASGGSSYSRGPNGPNERKGRERSMDAALVGKLEQALAENAELKERMVQYEQQIQDLSTSVDRMQDHMPTSANGEPLSADERVANLETQVSERASE